MCLLARFVCYAVLIAAGMSLEVLCAHAQGRKSGEAAIGEVVLPSAPEPQTAAPSSESSWPGDALARSEEREEFVGQEQQRAQLFEQASASLSGTVTDTNGEAVPGATIVLEAGQQPQDHRTAITSETGGFHFDGLEPGVPYHITAQARDLESWKSERIILEPGQYFYLKVIRLKVHHLVTDVTVYATQEQIAAQQVETETKQRVFGFIPNFYVTYDPNPVPLTTSLKFKIALKADTDIVTFLGVGFMAGIYQAGDMVDYGQGAQGYVKRVAAGHVDATTDIFFGGAIYPWLFRQDPRYFYRGAGTLRSRTLHAVSGPYICKGDNGKAQPNYSSLLGDLTSGAISNIYYPESNRGARLLLQGFAITTGVRTVNGLIQEFLLRKLTPSARNSK